MQMGMVCILRCAIIIISCIDIEVESSLLQNISVYNFLCQLHFLIFISNKKRVTHNS